ncbi:hypothetical protein ACWGJ2_00805 [Streptomyces sp. NPDC054796]
MYPEYQRTGWEWDVIRMRAPLGYRVLDQLGDATGRVCRDEEGLYLFFVPVDQAPEVGVGGAEILRGGTWLCLPPPERERGEGPRWLRPYGRGLCDPERLAAALEAALTDECSRRSS